MWLTIFNQLRAYLKQIASFKLEHASISIVNFYEVLEYSFERFSRIDNLKCKLFDAFKWVFISNYSSERHDIWAIIRETTQDQTPLKYRALFRPALMNM